MPPKVPDDDSQLFSGPKVARTALPKSMKTSDSKEDPLTKRIFFYLSGRAFTSGAYLVGYALILGVIFTILVTIKGFLCPDIATDQKNMPRFCPQKTTTKQQQ